MKNIFQSTILLLYSITVFWLSFYVRDPFFAKVRDFYGILVVFLAIFGIYLTYLVKKQKFDWIFLYLNKFRRWGKRDTKTPKKHGTSTTNYPSIALALLFISVSLLSFAFGYVMFKNIQFEQLQEAMLSEDYQMNSEYNGRFIIGYKDVNEVKKLVEFEEVAGLYLTRRNFEGKTAEQIREEIDLLQEIRQENNLPELIVSADHEGGIVSELHIEPWAEDTKKIGEVVNDKDEITDAIAIEVKEIASQHGKDLTKLGINTNFSPVVDLKYDSWASQFSASKLELRSISSSFEITNQAAGIYIQALSTNDIIPTLKHYPGLGSSVGDTHTSDESVISKTKLELITNDLQPFIALGKECPDCLIMLSHAKVEEIDSNLPASFSKNHVEFIRNNLELDNKLVTDDFSMASVYNSKDGIHGAVKKALEAEVDYILISYDTDLVFEILDGLK